MPDEEWWLHLYVMFSRATCMDDMLLVRPPPRELLEAGPPQGVKAALEKFDKRRKASADAAVALARKWKLRVPE